MNLWHTIHNIIVKGPSNYGLSPFFHIHTNDIVAAIHDYDKNCASLSKSNIKIYPILPNTNTNFDFPDSNLPGWFIVFSLQGLNSSIVGNTILLRLISNRDRYRNLGLIFVTSSSDFPQHLDGIFTKLEMNNMLSTATSSVIKQYFSNISDRLLPELEIMERIASPSKTLKFIVDIIPEYTKLVNNDQMILDCVRNKRIEFVNSIPTMKIEKAVEPEMVIGLKDIKRWIHTRFTYAKDKIYPRGILILGIPGTGKSMIAKAIGGMLNRTVIRYNPSAIYDKNVGSSESNIRRDTAILDMLGDSIIFIDEIEKQFSGIQSSGSTDGGVTSRVIGNFISWLQDRKSNSFVIATANSIEGLPQEMLRTDRFDEIFFVDFPTEEERQALFDIYINEIFGSDTVDKKDIAYFAKITDQYTGADIKYIVTDSYYTFKDSSKKSIKSIILDTIDKIIPFSKKFPERVKELQEQKKYFRIVSE